LFSLLFSFKSGSAQTTSASEVQITSLLQELESQFNIKFSFVDDDLANIQIKNPRLQNLADIFKFIEEHTPLSIEKLNERYYSVVKRKSVTVCAFVLDNYKKNTIPGASVQVLGTEKAIITDANGGFTISDVAVNGLLEIKHLGFKTLFIRAAELAKSPCTTLTMALVYQELEEVVVYKFLTTGLSKLNDGRIELATEKFGILPGMTEPDVLQTVQALPGVKSVDETVSDLNIRGGTNDQNLLLWDGIKMYQSGHFFGLISAFNPYLTERVTLTKNGTSALYGDGISGTIDMQTKNSIQNRFFGGAGVNLISGDLFGQVPLSNKLALQFSGRRSHTDFLDTPTFSTFSEKAFQDTDVASSSDFYFYDFTGKVLYDINADHSLRVSLINMTNTVDYAEIIENSGQSNRSNLNQTNLSFGGTLESAWSNSFSSSFIAYYTNYKLNALTNTNGIQQLLQNNRVLETSAKLNTTFIIAPNTNWLNGYQFTETGIENITNVSQPFFESSIKGVIRSHALYTELDYVSTNGKLFARIGARINYYENLDTFQEILLEPRINFSYALATNLKTEVMGEFKSQATNQVIDLEQNFLGIEKRRWILANGTELPLTKSRQASLGINYDKSSFYVGLEGFYKEVDGININTQGFQNQNQFNGEIGQYAISGLEFLLNKKNNDYSTWLSYTYNINTYTFESLTPQSFPNNLDIRHTVTLAGTYSYGPFKIGLGFNYRSGRPFTQPLPDNPINTAVVPSEINYSVPNSTRLPEYIRADVSALYDFEFGEGVKGMFGVSMLNFTNRKNLLNTFYRLNDANTVETVQRFSLGATPNISFRLSF
jgi:outer membrane cobalamin receptor